MKWFNRLMLAYLPVFIIISLSLLLMTYLTLSEMSKKATIKSNEALSHNIIKLIDNKLESIEFLLQYEILNNDRIRQFFEDSSSKQKQYTDIQAAVSLKELVHNNPIIDSIYLYRTPDQTVLTQSKITQLSQFEDREYIGLTSNSRNPYEWTTRAIAQSGNGQSDKRVISLAKNTNLKNFSFLIVNIRVEMLQEWIMSMADKQTTFVHLTDSNGNLIVSTDNYSSDHDEVSRSGIFQSSVASEYTGWIISSGNRNGGILEFISSLFYVWMALATLIIIAGFYWIIYVSRRQYKPIQSLINRISGAHHPSFPLIKGGKMDEFKLIETTFDDLLDESNALQEQHKELSVYHKRHLFLTLMENTNTNSNFSHYVQEEIVRLGISESVEGALVAIVEIDHYAEFAEQYRNDQHLLKYILGASIKELTENKPYTVWTEWISNFKMGILFLFHQSQQETDVIECCEKLRTWVANNLDFTITIGVGEETSDIAKTSGSFRSALNAVGYKTSLGINRLITSEHVGTKPKGELFKQLQFFRNISQSYRIGEEKWEEYYREMFQSLQDQLYTREDLTSLMHVLLGYLQKEITELSVEINELWNRDVHPLLIAALEEETQEKVCEAFYDVLKNAFEHMSLLRESKTTYQLTHQIKQYIEEHYSNPDFSLTELSHAFGLTSKYLSKLFREAFGLKFIEFVSNTRMEKAMQLLIHTDETIQDIGRAVGYDQSLTFIRVFKKHTGDTPGQYRKKNRES